MKTFQSIWRLGCLAMLGAGTVLAANADRQAGPKSCSDPDGALWQAQPETEEVAHAPVALLLWVHRGDFPVPLAAAAVLEHP